ncbi:MAG: aldo/keto reductase [Nitrososphaerota archaeon]|nr:aldo/keto reductase [Candidatus Calditenuaceae archaeon]MDW8073847.1 aldo/keto reductase [Nitrososphaerota archaeon]
MEYKRLGKTDEKIAAIGLGTWRMGGSMSPDHSQDLEIVEAIRYAVELGMNHIDTAEMYGAGHSEELVGRAIKVFPRDQVFIATKVWYTNLRYDDVLQACERSLKRLGVKYVDLYMIHWPNERIPVSETMKAMEKLYKDGKIRYIGVSNFSTSLVEEAQSSLSTTDIVANQVEYGLHNRHIERDLLPYCEKNGITITAYSPLGQGRLAMELRARTKRTEALQELANRYIKTPVQIALNWVIWRENVITIPKAIKKEHLEENAGASGWRLTPEDYKRLSDSWK